MDRYVPTSANLRYHSLVFRVVCNNSDALFQENDFFQQRERKKRVTTLYQSLPHLTQLQLTMKKTGQTYFLLIFVFFWKPHDENLKAFCYKLSKVHDECLKCKFSLSCKRLITAFKSL